MMMIFIHGDVLEATVISPDFQNSTILDFFL